MNRLLLMFVCAGVLVTGQPTDPRLAAKLAEPFAKRLSWHTTLASALAAAKERDTHVLLYVTRLTPPTPPVQQLEKSAFLTDWWATDTARLVPLLHVITGAAEVADRDLPAQLGVADFPFVAFLDLDGTVLTRIAVTDAANLKRDLEFLDRHLAFRRAPNDRVAASRWSMARLERRPDPAEYERVKATVASLGSEDALSREFARFARRYAVLSLTRTYAKEIQAARFRGTAIVAEIERRFQADAFERFKKGARPIDEPMDDFNFVRLAFDGAMEARDRTCAQLAFNWIEVWAQQYPHQQRLVDTMRTRLAELARELKERPTTPP